MVLWIEKYGKVIRNYVSFLVTDNPVYDLLVTLHFYFLIWFLKLMWNLLCTSSSLKDDQTQPNHASKSTKKVYKSVNRSQTRWITALSCRWVVILKHLYHILVEWWAAMIHIINSVDNQFYTNSGGGKLQSIYAWIGMFK